MMGFDGYSNPISPKDYQKTLQFPSQGNASFGHGGPIAVPASGPVPVPVSGHATGQHVGGHPTAHPTGGPHPAYDSGMQGMNGSRRPHTIGPYPSHGMMPPQMIPQQHQQIPHPMMQQSYPTQYSQMSQPAYAMNHMPMPQSMSIQQHQRIPQMMPPQMQQIQPHLQPSRPQLPLPRTPPPPQHHVAFSHPKAASQSPIPSSSIGHIGQLPPQSARPPPLVQPIQPKQRYVPPPPATVAAATAPSTSQPDSNSVMSTPPSNKNATMADIISTSKSDGLTEGSTVSSPDDEEEEMEVEDDRDDDGDYEVETESSSDEDEMSESEEEEIRGRGRRTLRKRPRTKLILDSDEDVVPRKRTKRRLPSDEDESSDYQSSETESETEDSESDEPNGRAARKRRLNRLAKGGSKKKKTKELAQGWRQSTRQAASAAADYSAYTTYYSSEEDPENIIWTYEAEQPAEPEELPEVVDLVLSNRPPEDRAEEEDVPYEERVYLVKWKDRSHLHDTWETYETLQKTKGFGKIKNYIRACREVDALKTEPESRDEYEQKLIEREVQLNLVEDMKHVERVVASREVEASDENQSGVEYLCKWKRLFYDSCTWESGDVIQQSFQVEIDAFLARNASPKVPHRSINHWKERPKFVKIKEQPGYLVGGNLREYQMIGVNWMLYLWARHESGILADEMGLGKTVQTISTLSVLHNKYNVFGPFLVVVPLSVMHSWEAEFTKWAPDLNLIVYAGNAKAREVIREHEFYAQGGGKNPKLRFNVLLTTFELVLKDKDYLDQYKWAALAIDEAHRLKNQGSQRHEALREFTTAYRLLITGTPLQNTIKELYSLISFLMPHEFRDFEDFEVKEGAEGQSEQIQRLHARLKPFMLRRLKKDVEKSLPNRIERILRVELSPMQLHYYTNILKKNFGVLNRGLSAGSQLSLLNVAMELKKSCNHPYLFPSAEDMNKSRAEILKGMVMNSGKMVLLDKLLARLKEDGHRVLIFSQMVRMLDILSDYASYRGYVHQRLDGSVGPAARKRAVELFNAPDSRDFLFLLSTRAGGLGLNLATADTVIIFDSDWNPQNDLQAMARAHRIGQKKQVAVYRFISKGTIEEDVIERAKRKRVLEYCVIHQMDTSGSHVLQTKAEQAKEILKQDGSFNKDELNAMLKFGAQNLFKDKSENNKLEQMDLDDILSRAEANATEDAALAEGGDELLAQFQVTDFNGGTGPSWEDIIPEEERIKMEEQEKHEEEELMNRRRAARINADFTDIPPNGGVVPAPSKNGRKESKRTRKSTGNSVPKVKKGSATKMKPQKQDISKMFSEKEQRALSRALMKYGDVDRRIEQIVEESNTADKDRESVKALLREFIEVSAAALADPDLKEVTVYGEPFTVSRGSKVTLAAGKLRVSATDLTQRVEDLTTLYTFLEGQNKKDMTKFRLGFDIRTINSWSVPWTPKDDSLLLIGIMRYGYGNWAKVKEDASLQLQQKLFLDEDMLDKQPRQDHIERRATYLLKTIRERVGAPKKKKVDSKPRGRSTRNSMDAKHADTVVEVTDTREAFEPVEDRLQNIRASKGETDSQKKAQIIMESLIKIGDHIAALMRIPEKNADPEEYPTGVRWAGLKRMSKKERRELEAKLWSYVTTFWPSDQSMERIKELYIKVSSSKSTPKKGSSKTKKNSAKRSRVSTMRSSSPGLSDNGETLLHSLTRSPAPAHKLINDLEEGELNTDSGKKTTAKRERSGSGSSAQAKSPKEKPSQGETPRSSPKTKPESHPDPMSDSGSSLSPVPSEFSELEEGEYVPSHARRKRAKVN